MQDLSRQQTILQKLTKRESLFCQDTAARKDQFLPDFFFGLVRKAEEEEAVPVLKPIEVNIYIVVFIGCYLKGHIYYIFYFLFYYILCNTNRKIEKM